MPKTNKQSTKKTPNPVDMVKGLIGKRKQLLDALKPKK